MSGRGSIISPAVLATHCPLSLCPSVPLQSAQPGEERVVTAVRPVSDDDGDMVRLPARFSGFNRKFTVGTRVA